MMIWLEEKVQESYDLVKSQGALEKVYQDLQTFKEGVGGEVAFTKIMMQETIPNASKEALLKDLLTYLEKETQIFLDSFIKEEAYAYIYRAIKAFEEIYERHHLTITTVVPLSQEQVDSILDKVSKKMHHDIHTYSCQIDESLLGGVKLASGDFLIDGSLAAQLVAFKQTF